MLDIFEGHSRKKGLQLYRKRIEVMVVRQNNECPQIKVFINGNKLKQAFNSNTRVLYNQVMDATTLKRHQEQHKQKRIQRMKSILTNSHISIHT